MDEDYLPLQLDDYTELIRLCVEFGPFEFSGREYEQIQGFAMGSPLSAVLVQLFMESLVSDHYHNNVVWLRYVDDIHAVVPTRTNPPDLLHRLNAVHPSIQFTTEEERDEKLPFLDTMIHRKPDGPIFSAEVMRRPRGEDTQSKTQRIIITHSEVTEHLEALVGCTLKIATSSGKKIGDKVREKRSNHNKPLSQMYIIPCGGCDKVYIGETARGLHEQRISQHRSALQRHDTRSASVVHIDTDGHLPKWSQASIIKQGLAPRQRKMVEAAFIHTTNNNTATGRYELAKVVVHLITDVT
ncbi:uncharacterized protein [Penaeus vannamei]|uniref:uncharacterized protein n=1 Tax=Penaeus vannamei TaxID=6689 RepID=UPI00387F8CBE